MGISVLGGSAAVSGLTDQGGTVVVSRYIDGKSSISSSDLPVGSYFFNFIGSGRFLVKPYSAENELGVSIAAGSGSEAGSVYRVTVPADANGIYIDGFTGSLIVQSIPLAREASITTSTYEAAAQKSDFSTWSPIYNSNKFIRIQNNLATVYDPTTEESNSSSMGNSDLKAEIVETPSGYLITSQGYWGGGTYYYKRSINNGASWQDVQSYDAIDYATAVRWMDNGTPAGAVCINSPTNGYGQASRNLRYSLDEGATWSYTLLPYPTTGYFGPVSYVGGLYIIVQGRTGYSAGQSYNQTYWTSPDLNTWTQRSMGLSYNGDWVRQELFNNKFYLMGRLSGLNRTVFVFTSDGINWSQANVPYIDSYEDPPQEVVVSNVTGTFTSRTAVTKDANGDDEYLYTDLYTYNGGNLLRLTTSNSMTILPGLASSPFGTSNGTKGLLPAVTNNTLIVRAISSHFPNSAGWHNYYTQSSISGLPILSSYPYQVSATYSPDFDRWYVKPNYIGNIYVSGIGDPLSYPISLGPNNQVISQVIIGPGWIGWFAGSTFYKSTNGYSITSTVATSKAASNTGQNEVANMGNTIVATADYQSRVLVSTDGGANWSLSPQIYNNSNMSNTWYPFILDGTWCLMSSNNGSMAYSYDALTWTMAPGTSWGTSFRISEAQCSYNGRFNTGVYNGAYRTTASPTAGLSNASFPYTNTNVINMVAVGQTWAAIPNWSAIGQFNNFFYTSSDGLSWTQRSLLSPDKWFTIMGSDGKVFIAAKSSENSTTLASLKLKETITIS